MNKNEIKHKQWHIKMMAFALIITILTVFSGCASNTDKLSAAPPSPASTAESSQSSTADDGIAKKETSSQTAAGTEQTAASDLVIPISDITEIAKFYPVKVDGVKMEVLAVKAPDGSIRTAFNTCQVCYDSGKGYYKQEGDALVCQNCGNRFKMDQVEVQSGSCNPVPIFSDNKTVDDKNITISADFLTQAKAIFANWKTEY